MDLGYGGFQVSVVSVMDRVRDLRYQAELARERAAQATMSEDKASWLNLAAQWNQLAKVEATHLPAWRPLINASQDVRPGPN